MYKATLIICRAPRFFVFLPLTSGKVVGAVVVMIVSGSDWSSIVAVMVAIVSLSLPQAGGDEEGRMLGRDMEVI